MYKVGGRKVECLTNEQVTSWLLKTRKSIEIFVNTGSGLINSQRAYDLIDRYSQLKREAINRKDGVVWRNYCNETKQACSHDAYDCFA